MSRAYFLFFGRLNDLLPRDQREQTISIDFRGRQSIKHLAESLGVPHPEIGRVRVHGQAGTLSTITGDGDRVELYPIPDGCLVEPRFVLDNHLGRLAAYLRMLGFDCLYQIDFGDEVMAEIVQREGRILLSRDRGRTLEPFFSTDFPREDPVLAYFAVRYLGTALDALRLEHPDLHWFFPLPRPEGAASPERLRERLDEHRAAELETRRQNPYYLPRFDRAPAHFLAAVRSIQHLASLRHEGGRPGEVYRSIANKALLHLAAILHDLGKGYVQDHSDVGAWLAVQTAARLGLDEHDTAVGGAITRRRQERRAFRLAAFAAHHPAKDEADLRGVQLLTAEQTGQRFGDGRHSSLDCGGSRAAFFLCFLFLLPVSPKPKTKAAVTK